MNPGDSARQNLDEPCSPLDVRTVESFADWYTLVVNADGTCVLNPRVPKLVGTTPWSWCIEEDEKRCRDMFVEACMFRKEDITFDCSVRFDGRVIQLSFRLFPLETGQVLALFQRHFNGELSLRERHVLALLAGGAKSFEIAKGINITPSTARDHVANIEGKLSIRHREGFRLAAHQFGLAPHAAGA